MALRYHELHEKILEFIFSILIHKHGSSLSFYL